MTTTVHYLFRTSCLSDAKVKSDQLETDRFNLVMDIKELELDS